MDGGNQPPTPYNKERMCNLTSTALKNSAEEEGRVLIEASADIA
jgi:hypothetical protein